MNKIIYFLFTFILFSSCSQENDTLKMSNLDKIAASKWYKAYGERIAKDLSDFTSGIYDLDEVSTYVSENYGEADDLCRINFSDATVRGLAIYIRNTCEVTQAYRKLIQEFPSYELLSYNERKQTHKLYMDKYKDGSSIGSPQRK